MCAVCSRRPVDELHLHRRPADPRRAGGEAGHRAHLRAQQDAHRRRQHRHHRYLYLYLYLYLYRYLNSGAAAPPAGGLTCLLFWSCRVGQHQRQEHAGKEGQRGGGDRGGLGDGYRGDGRAGVPGRQIRPAAPPRVLQVRKRTLFLLIYFPPPVVLRIFMPSLCIFSSLCFFFR